MRESVFSLIDQKREWINSAMCIEHRVDFCKNYLKDKITLSTFEMDLVEFIRNEFGLTTIVNDNGSVTLRTRDSHDRTFECYEDAMYFIAGLLKGFIKKGEIDAEPLIGKYIFRKTKYVHAASKEEAIEIMENLDPDYEYYGKRV